MTGSEQYAHRALYFSELASFLDEHPTLSAEGAALSKNCRAISAMYDARSRIHDHAAGVRLRAAALVGLLRTKVAHHIPAVEYGFKSTAKDLVSLFR